MLTPGGGGGERERERERVFETKGLEQRKREGSMRGKPVFEREREVFETKVLNRERERGL